MFVHFLELRLLERAKNYLFCYRRSLLKHFLDCYNVSGSVGLPVPVGMNDEGSRI